MLNRITFLVMIATGILASCGTQKRLQQSVQKSQIVKKAIQNGGQKLDSLQKLVSEQDQQSVIDSVLTGAFHQTIQKLQQNLDRIGETVTAVELLAKKKSNFRERKFYHSTVYLVNRLDSFQLAEHGRERVFELLSKAVNSYAFHRFDMGTFFEPGAYKIPLSAVDKIYQPFRPAVDSMVRFSNNYSDVKHKVYMVFVGYADATPIVKSSILYQELKRYIPGQQEPSRESFNLTLSQLRANELERNMKLILSKKVLEFNNYQLLNIGYFSYGRGEAFPFKNITDYRVQDERRRVVVFYWSVLPVVD